MGRWLSVWVPALLMGGALAVITWAAGEQAQTQGQMNVAMTDVLHDLREARQLTARTALALDPLRPTAEAIETMNGRLRAMVADMRAMNGSLDQITGHQQRILDGVSSLGEKTAGLVGTLAAVEGHNRQLSGTTAALGAQAHGHVEKMDGLARRIDTAIEQLRILNGRFEFLRTYM